MHAETRALLEYETMLSEDGQEICGIVTSNVPHERVKGAPACLMKRHREDDSRIVLGDPAELAKDLLVVFDMLDNVKRTDQVKAAVWVWQCGNLAEHRGQGVHHGEHALRHLVGRQRVLLREAGIPESGFIGPSRAEMDAVLSRARTAAAEEGVEVSA